MTPQIAAGICSLMGAIFFFGAGFFFAKHRLTIDQDMLDHQIQSAKEREDSIREKAIQDNISFKRSLEMQKQKNEAYKKATQKRISELKEQIIRLDGVIGDYKERLGDLLVEVTRADSENVLLAEALETNKKDIQSLEKKNQDLSNSVKILKLQNLDIENLRQENRDLAVKVAQMENLEAQINALKEENARHLAISKANVSDERMTSLYQELGETFQALVNKILQLDGSHGVVVADRLGVLIAGTGDHMDSMAAIAAIYSEVDHRSPFDDIEVIKIQSPNELTISMHPFIMDSEKLVLVTLTTGSGPDRDAIARLAEQAMSA